MKHHRPALALPSRHSLPKSACAVSVLTLALAQPVWAAQSMEIGAVNIDAASVLTPTEKSQVSYQAVSSTVASRTEAPLVETPASVSVVTHRVIEDRAPQSLDEAINAVAGVKQGNTLGGTQDAILKRGFGTNRDNSIMRDGLQSVTARNFTPTTERIEVLKGPASMLYGVQDPGGVINVVTKKPQLTQATSLSGWGTSFGGGGGQIDTTGPLGNTGLAYRFIYDKQQYDYWRDFGSTDQEVIAPSLSWFGEDTTITGAYEHMEYSVPFDRGTQINTQTGKVLDIPRARRLDEHFNITTGRSDSFNLNAEHRLNDDWTLRAGYGYSRNYYNDHQQRYISGNFTTGYITRRGDATRDALQVAHTATVNALGNVELLGMRHEMLVGVDYMKNDRTLGDLMRSANESGFNYNDPVYGTVPVPATVSAKDSDQTDKLHTHALFVQDNIHLNDQWILQAGLRYESFTEYTGKGRPFVVGADVDKSKAVPRLGLVYMIQPDWSVYGSYSKSFRPNTSIATAIGDLPPEEGTAYEVGTKFQNDNLTASLAAFNIVKQNVQTSVTCADGSSCVRAGGEARSRGIELEVTGQLSRAWSVTGSYAYTDTEWTEDPILKGRPLDGVSKNTAALYFTRDFGQVGIGNLRAGLGGRYMSKWGANDGATSNNREYYLPDATVADAFVAYKLKVEQRDVTLQLNVKNLFDETYYVSSSGTGSPAIVIGEPRQVIGKVTLAF
jgi:iron complex outermembrane receptor protein